MHGYLPEATCSGVELAKELAVAIYSKGPAAGNGNRADRDKNDCTAP